MKKINEKIDQLKRFSIIVFLLYIVYCVCTSKLIHDLTRNSSKGMSTGKVRIDRHSMNVKQMIKVPTGCQKKRQLADEKSAGSWHKQRKAPT